MKLKMIEARISIMEGKMIYLLLLLIIMLFLLAFFPSVDYNGTEHKFG